MLLALSVKASISTLLSLFLTSYVSPTFTENITTPADGFTLVITSNANNSWQIIRPTSNLLTGTITLPLVTDAADGQEIIITTTLQIAALTINGNGATAVYGAPGVLAAEDNFTLKFNSTTNSWYKV